MKKKTIFTLVTMFAVLVLASCNKYEPKAVKLKNANDSLNYTLGLANGKSIKMQYMMKDSSDKAVAVLMEAINESYKMDPNKSEMYKLGYRIGQSFKQMEKSGLMNDSTLKFNSDIVRQGIINALKSYDKTMNNQKAQEILNNAMSKVQDSQMQQEPVQQQTEPTNNQPVK